MQDKNGKFRIGDGDDIEQNISRLQKELDNMLLKGAPKIKEVPVDEEIKRPKLEEKKIEDEQKKKVPLIPEKKQTISYNTQPIISHKKTFMFLKDRRFYIAVFGVVAFAFTLIKAPIFRYTTPMRHDNDLPGIDVCFKYYNNLFGRQTKSETIINIGGEVIVVPISMERWFNLDREKKIMVIEHYRKK